MPGGLIEQGFSLDLAIISDGAGQFAILRHALCRVHAERLVHTLIALNDHQRADQARVRGEIWALYADLKAYRRNPDPALRPGLEARFDTIFTQRTSYITLDRTLKRLHTHKSELLLVLERPDVVLHTNGSESDIRGDVKWRKISGATRSALGKDCRDGFASLKKTCRNPGISFWDDPGDRIKQLGTVPLLSDIIQRSRHWPGSSLVQVTHRGENPCQGIPAPIQRQHESVHGLSESENRCRRRQP